jgi:hypothetical protein
VVEGFVTHLEGLFGKMHHNGWGPGATTTACHGEAPAWLVAVGLGFQTIEDRIDASSSWNSRPKPG